MNARTAARFKDAPWYAQYTISIGGCGGIGSWVSLFLSRIGHELILYDHDRVDESNIGGQLYNRTHIGMQKSAAIAKVCNEFAEHTLLHEAGFFDENCEPTSIMFSCFDNMSARKVFFQTWKKTFCNEKSINGDFPVVFIDGRLEAETAIIYMVRNEKEAEMWEKEWFSDDKVKDAPCTFRATTHNGAMIASLMVAALNNFVTNFKEKEDFRTTPWKTHYELPTFTFKAMESEEYVKQQAYAD